MWLYPICFIIAVFLSFKAWPDVVNAFLFTPILYALLVLMLHPQKFACEDSPDNQLCKLINKLISLEKGYRNIIFRTIIIVIPTVIFLASSTPVWAICCGGSMLVILQHNQV